MLCIIHLLASINKANKQYIHQFYTETMSSKFPGFDLSQRIRKTTIVASVRSFQMNTLKPTSDTEISINQTNNSLSQQFKVNLKANTKYYVRYYNQFEFLHLIFHNYHYFIIVKNSTFKTFIAAHFSNQLARLWTSYDWQFVYIMYH